MKHDPNMILLHADADTLHVGCSDCGRLFRCGRMTAASGANNVPVIWPVYVN